MMLKKNIEFDIPEGVPAGLWDMLRSMKADTAATALMVDRLVSRVVNLEELQDTSLAEKVDKLANTIDNLTARLAKNEKVTDNIIMKENLIVVPWHRNAGVCVCVCPSQTC